MADYRRIFKPGGTFFFTVVTKDRRPMLRDEAAVQILREAVAATREIYPFTIVASVVLPDHLHMIWKLPEGDAAYDRRWSAIKQHFTRKFLAGGGVERGVTQSQEEDRRRGVWQRRFYEHTVRDEDDLRHHVGYTHFNPVKHGYVVRPADWGFSSLHRWVREGRVGADWGCGEVDAERYATRIPVK